MHPKQYGVVLRNELTRRVYRNFGAFPIAGLNRCLGNQKKKIFSLFCQSIPAKDVWQAAYLKSIFGTTLWQMIFDDGNFTNLNTIMLWQNLN